MNVQQLIIDSAEAAAQTVGTPDFAKLTAKAIELAGDAMAAHLVSTDGPGLFVPVEIEVDGKSRLGAVLALGDRAILAWTTMRMLKIGNYEAVIAYDSISVIEQEQQPGNPLHPRTAHLEVAVCGRVRRRAKYRAAAKGRAGRRHQTGVLAGSWLNRLLSATSLSALE